ncbi:response regulator transcription factor [Pseudonocardia sp. CA-142604]|uniref:response regulator transcription factor n=1 Tax=Pseudonocardia sp. CA-142604 TaxID=3240024 RepID=UPI003D8E858F
MTSTVTAGAELEEARHLFALLRTAGGAVPDPALRARIADLAEQLVAALRDPADAGDTTLSAREIDVLAHAAVGRRNSEIAECLALTGETVKSYLRSAMTKLGVHSRHAAVDSARRAGVIP